MITLPTIPAEVEFARPAFLWLLLALPLLWLRLSDRRLGVLIARTLIVALVVVTLADPQSRERQSSSQRSVFAFDVSASVPPSMRDWMTRAADSAPTPGDRIYLFGSAAAQVEDWRSQVSGSATIPGVLPDKTNLENLLSAVLAGANGAANLYLFTDGWENQGNVERRCRRRRQPALKFFRLSRPSAPRSQT